MDHKKDTWFEKIYQVPAGELIIINNDKNIFREKWYDLEGFKKVSLPKKTSDKRNYIDNTFLKVCEEHLNSDTKIGIKLSGGLDSSTMLASMEKKKSI